MNRPRIIIAGAGSGAGKTTATLGLMAALRNRGKRVQGFKAGPDYIDPGFHASVTGRPSRNLDTWMVSEETVKEIFLRGSEGADISVIEGVMGLYDGKDPQDDTGSTAELAIHLKTPVILVVDVSGMARSAAAVVLGFQKLRPEVSVLGVIANRAGGEGHFRLVRAAVEKECGIPVIGWLPDDPSLKLPERHLGLVPAVERGELKLLWDRLGEVTARHVDLDALEIIAQGAPALNGPSRRVFVPPVSPVKERPVIAVARDAAFHFYYPENLELLKLHGAELRFFSPLAGEPVPEEADGLLIGGGFPEEFAEPLSRNEEVKASFRRAVAEGLPTYAECGGYMYLCREIIDRQGRRWPMADIIPASVRMGDRLAALGYREVTAAADSVLLRKGEQAKGHEFHWSVLTPLSEPYPPAYEIRSGSRTAPEGFLRGNLLAGYTHLHFASNPEMVRRWVCLCGAWREKKGER